MPRWMPIGFAPAVTYFMPSRKIASARMVAVVVPSPATSPVLLATSRTICAPMFSQGSSRSISFATVTPSLVTVGPPNFLSITTLRPLGPSVAFTARLIFSPPGGGACRAPSSKINCFAAIINFAFWLRNCRSFDDRKDVVGGENSVFLPVQFDFRAAIFGYEHAVAFLHFERDLLPLVVCFTSAEGYHQAFHRFFFGRVGNDDSALFGFLLFDRFHEDAVADGFKL